MEDFSQSNADILIPRVATEYPPPSVESVFQHAIDQNLIPALPPATWRIKWRVVSGDNHIQSTDDYVISPQTQHAMKEQVVDGLYSLGDQLVPTVRSVEHDDVQRNISATRNIVTSTLGEWWYKVQTEIELATIVTQPEDGQSIPRNVLMLTRSTHVHDQDRVLICTDINTPPTDGTSWDRRSLQYVQTQKGITDTSVVNLGYDGIVMQVLHKRGISGDNPSENTFSILRVINGWVTKKQNGIYPITDDEMRSMQDLLGFDFTQKILDMKQTKMAMLQPPVVGPEIQLLNIFSTLGSKIKFKN